MVLNRVPNIRSREDGHCIVSCGRVSACVAAAGRRRLAVVPVVRHRRLPVRRPTAGAVLPHRRGPAAARARRPRGRAALLPPPAAETSRCIRLRRLPGQWPDQVEASRASLMGLVTHQICSKIIQRSSKAPHHTPHHLNIQPA